MNKWPMMGMIGTVIVVSLLIFSMLFPIGYLPSNVTHTNQYPVYGNSKVVIAPEGRNVIWSIHQGNGTAVMENFTLSKSAIMTGSWNSTIPTVIYTINYTINKTYLTLPTNSSLYALSGSFDSLHLPAGQYLLIVGTIFHGNWTVTFNQPFVADYIT